LNTNRFSELVLELMKDNLPSGFAKNFPANNAGVEHSPKFSLPKP